MELAIGLDRLPGARPSGAAHDRGLLGLVASRLDSPYREERETFFDVASQAGLGVGALAIKASNIAWVVEIGLVDSSVLVW